MRKLFLALGGFLLISLIAIATNEYAFEGRWHNASYSRWIFVVGIVSCVVFFISWKSLSPLFEELVIKASARLDLVTFLVRSTVASIMTAFVFRLVTPKDSSWFGDLGDFLNPPLAAVSLAALALALKVSSEQVKEQELSRKLAGSPWVIIEEVREASGDLVVSAFCIGEGPALNVRIGLYEGEKGSDTGTPIIILPLAILSSEKPIRQLLRQEGKEQSLPENFWAHIEWQSSHLLQFSYKVHLSQRQGGVWLPASAVLPQRDAFFREI